MAIQKTVISKQFDVNVQDAYIKLVYFRWSTADQKAVAQFSVWASQQAYTDKKDAVDLIEVEAVTGFEGLQKKLYDYMKTKAEYAGSIDI